MTTYGTMQARIADEITRSDLSTQIQAAIQSAILHYGKEPFYFNEQQATAPTVASQEYYDMPSDIVEMQTLSILVNNSKYPLIHRPFEYIEAVSITTNTPSQPTDYTVFRQKFRLYPIPGAVYTLYLAYIRTLPVLGVAADTNAWMVTAEEMIRGRAKWDLHNNLTKNAIEAEKAKSLETTAYRQLLNQSTGLILSNRVTPTSF